MIDYGRDVIIEDGAVINVVRGRIGDRSIIRSGARIEGTFVDLGTESYLDHGAWIGGGSCFDEIAYLEAGDWLHMGWNSQINIARGVTIGHEVGVGIETKIFTHGAYLPLDQGFPVQWAPVSIGNRVWLPHCWVNPGCHIGNNIVVMAMSLVNSNIPDGCLAGGIPAKIIRSGCFPNNVKLVDPPKMIEFLGISYRYSWEEDHFEIGNTRFYVSNRVIDGPVTEDTEKIKNQLRRNGIRFRFTAKNGKYVSWNEF